MDNKALFQIIQKALWGTNDASANKELFEELTAQAIECLAAPVLLSLNLSEELLKEWKKQVLRHVVHYNAYLNFQNNLSITVPYVILKGTAAAQYYPYPEYRTMGDIDVMTKHEDYAIACRELLENGYTEITSKNDLERNRHREFEKDGFSVEVHAFFASMNDPIKAAKFDNLIIQNITETHVLPHDVNGLVLLEHINQHLEEGLGLRQIIDWMMFVDKQLPDEKWHDFQMMAAATGLEKLAVTITRMCEMELGLRSHTWSSKANERLCMELLSYILACGNFGQKRSFEEEVALERVAKLSHPIVLVRELQKMGLNNWKHSNNLILKHFAWIKQGYKMAKSTSGLVEQLGVSNRLNGMLDKLEVRRAGKGLVFFENGQYVTKKPADYHRSDKQKRFHSSGIINGLQPSGKEYASCIVRQFGFGGGAPLSLFQHYLVLKGYGYQIKCLAHSSNDFLQAKYEEEFGIIINKKSSAELWDDKKIIKSFLQYRWEYKLIRRERPNLIIALGEFNGALYSYISKKLGIPLIVYIAGGMLSGQGLMIDLWQNCEVICFSKENEDEIIKHYPREHVHVISNRISVTQRFNDIEAHYQTEQPDVHVLITSRLAEDKVQSIYALIRLLSQCAGEGAHIVVRIAGKGPKEKELLAFCAEMETEKLQIQYLGHLDQMTEQFRWAHIAAGKGRSVIEPIMMNRIGCVIGEDGKISFCNDNNFENIYHYNFSGRNLETEDSLSEIRKMIEKINKGIVTNEDVIIPSELATNNYSADFLPEKMKKVLEKLPASKHGNARVFLLKQFFCLIISKFKERMIKT